MEFRTICKHMGTRSSQTLANTVHASDVVILDLTEVRQFAGVASAGSTRFHFPYKGSKGNNSSIFAQTQLVRSIQGSIASLDAFVAFRIDAQQLVAAISGTTTTAQILHDFRVSMHKYRYAPGAGVHTGFWRLYKGIRQDILAGIRDGLESHPVRELVITGHR
jgi:hypothetical protein